MSECTNIFLEPDGFCARCSKYHFRTNKRGDVVTKRKSVRKSVSKPEMESQETRIDEHIQKNPHLRIARETVQMLNELYDMEVRVVFRNRRGSYHQKRGNSHTIVFGYESCRRAYEEGFNEYASLEWMLNYQSPSGKAGAIQLALHEFAHALQTEVPGGRTYGSCHNRTFVEKYRELMDLVL